MKKMSKALILLLSIAFLFTSCDGSFSDVLSKMMDPFSKNNLYLNSGLVKPNMKDAEALNDIATNTESASLEVGEGGKLDLANSGSAILENVNNALSKLNNGTGIEITTGSSDDNIKAIATALTEGGILEAKDQSTISSTVNNALNSPTQTEQFKKNMSEAAPADSVTATQNTYKVGAAVINIVKKNITVSESNEAIINALEDLSTQISTKADSSSMTKGDVLQAQIITNLINTSAVVVTKDKNDLNLNDREVKDLVDGAILLINTSKTISGGLDLNGIDFGSLIPSGSSSTEETPASYSAARSISSSESDWNGFPTKEEMGDINIQDGYINLLDFGVAGAADVFVQVSSLTNKYDVRFRDTDANNGMILSGFYKVGDVNDSDIENRKKSFSLAKSLFNTLFTKGDGIFNGDILADRNQNFAYMLSGYKLLYSVADKDPAIRQYITDSNKAEISSVLESAMGFIANELPHFSKVLLEGDDKYINYIDAIYKNSKNLFDSDKIVVKDTAEETCSKLAIGEAAIVDFYNFGISPVDVVIRDKISNEYYKGLMWKNSADGISNDKLEVAFDKDTQDRITGHVAFLDSMIEQLELEKLVYEDLSYTDAAGETHHPKTLSALVELAFKDLNDKLGNSTESTTN